MKYLILVLFVMMTGMQAQALVSCHYSDVACDDQGNHFQCYQYGWSGDRQFCSAGDVGRKPAMQLFQGWDLNECIKECVEAGGAPSTCHHQCW